MNIGSRSVRLGEVTKSSEYEDCIGDKNVYVGLANLLVSVQLFYGKSGTFFDMPN